MRGLEKHRINRNACVVRMRHAVRPSFCWNADILQLLCHAQSQRTLRAQSDHPIVPAPPATAWPLARPGDQLSELACPFTTTTVPERLIGMHWTGRLFAAAHHEIALLGIIDPVARLCCLSVSPTPGQVGASQEGPHWLSLGCWQVHALRSIQLCVSAMLSRAHAGMCSPYIA